MTSFRNHWPLRSRVCWAPNQHN